MKLVVLKFPFGRKEHISNDSAELAIAVDRMSKHPDLARQLAPAIAAIKGSANLIELVERMSGRTRLNELVKAQFPQS